ncbi:Glu-tRNA(Gln) amidotransferase subunit GatE [Candidatus Woesearchaeota archaeon]|nr:Glu-tRNA(Gln) amidotransferase subunit GatE [Candidatus Woesearchaeota archaeon]
MNMDYQKLGFKCGIEIHQQLEGKKLFCNCSTANLRNTDANINFERKLRAVIGETGEVDKAAAYEMAKGKKFTYEGDSKDCCLVEMDEEPPHPVNKEAVQIALEVALLVKAKIVDEIQVMRKTVVDGSNVSGFQRTALIAYDGVLETSKGKVRIPTIMLEEEAAQKIGDTKDSVKYRLDRLGIPLIEISTEPDIVDPEHAKEVAEKIGMILRSTGKVKRGIGTIRQDVNVSIKGKNRVEIKGFQDVKSMPDVIEKEVERQIKLVKVPPEVRKVESDNTTSYLRPMPGAARMYPETDVMPLKVNITKIKLSELIEEKTKRFEKLGLGKDLANLISKSDKIEMFEKFVKEFKNIKPSFIAETLVPTLREINRKFGVDTETLTEKEFEEIFAALDKGKIPKNVVMDVLIDYASGKFESMDRYAGASDKEVEEEIKKIVKQKSGLSIGAYMGIVMSKFKGKIDGKKAMEILKKLLK